MRAWRQAFGKGDHYWHGEGYWSVTYEERCMGVSDRSCRSVRVQECSRITKSQQKRRSAFACIEACVPDLFASNILLFLPTGGPESEWAAIRKVLHAAMLDRGAYHYTERLQKLSSQIAAEFRLGSFEAATCSVDFDDTEKLRLMVVKCVFFMIFGIWLDDNDALILRKWRDYAVFFVLPRLIHRFIFNFAIGRVKQLRVDTVGVIEKHGLQPMFVEMNKNLPEKYRRPTDVKLCDEIMFAVGFAGIGGTSACCETVGAFLQRKIPEEASAHLISFEKYPTTEDMLEAYKASPVKYIKESCRIDPPVTSATRVDPDERELLFKGIPYTMPPETLNQYVISMANRDTKIFENPDVFDPTRKDLDQALTWNGAFGTPNEETVYPRICPGRFLALDVAQAIVGHVVGIKDCRVSRLVSQEMSGRWQGCANVLLTAGRRERAEVVVETMKTARRASRSAILFSMRHPHVVSLYDVHETFERRFLVMEFVDGGELIDEIDKNGPLPEHEARYVFLQIVLGLRYIHSKGVVHRDLKLENVLVDKASSQPGLLQVKISDFGHSKHVNDGYSRPWSQARAILALIRASTSDAVKGCLWCCNHIDAIL
eukprot:s1143_g15.t1